MTGEERTMAPHKPDPTDDDKPILIYTTFPDLASAESAAERLVAARLIACANIIPGMIAVYQWQGQRQREAEVVAILKTRSSLADRVMADVAAHHTYATPALLALAPEGASADYQAWIMAETADPIL
jgi:periplasmic divalent cation tolerance protein